MTQTHYKLPPLEKAANGRVCGLLKVMHQLKSDTPERLKALTHALTNPKETDVAISRHLRDWGIKLSDQIIRRHRTARCSCTVQMIPERMERYEYQ